MHTIDQKRNQYIAASLAVVASAVLIFLWMCLELPTYPSPAVWGLTAFAIYIPVICMASLYRSLVTEIQTAPTERSISCLCVPCIGTLFNSIPPCLPLVCPIFRALSTVDLFATLPRAAL